MTREWWTEAATVLGSGPWFTVTLVGMALGALWGIYKGTRGRR